MSVCLAGWLAGWPAWKALPAQTWATSPLSALRLVLLLCSWCLPPRLANPEASGGSADPRHLLPLQPLQPQQEPLGSTTSSGSSGTQQQRQQQRQYADAGEDFYFEWEEEWDVAGGRRGGRGGRGRGRGSSINALGAIVHSPLWHKRLLRCYSRVYAELMRRRKAAQPDRATALAWGLPV